MTQLENSGTWLIFSQQAEESDFDKDFTQEMASLTESLLFGLQQELHVSQHRFVRLSLEHRNFLRHIESALRHSFCFMSL